MTRGSPSLGAMTGREQVQQMAYAERALFDHLVGEREA